MKKLIVVVALFIALLTGGILEIVFTTKFFNDSYENVAAVEQSMEANKDGLNNDDTVSKMEYALDKWHKGKNLAMVMNNHNTIRNIDDKFVTLLRQITTDNYGDAIVTSASLLEVLKHMSEDNHLSVSNLF